MARDTISFFTFVLFVLFGLGFGIAIGQVRDRFARSDDVFDWCPGDGCDPGGREFRAAAVDGGR